MKMKINISKKKTIFLVCLIAVACFSVFVIGYGDNVVTDKQSFHPLWGIAKCVNDNSFTTACSPQNLSSVDYDRDGIIDSADRASACNGANILSTLSGPFTAATSSSNTKVETPLGAHKFCELSLVRTNIICSGGGTPKCSVSQNSGVWTLVADRNGSPYDATCGAICVD